MNKFIDNPVAAETFLKAASDSLRYLYYEPIKRAYMEQDRMFKCVALTHLNNNFKKDRLGEDDFNYLVQLLDYFKDPYERFIEEFAKRSWHDIKSNILGGKS